MVEIVECFLVIEFIIEFIFNFFIGNSENFCVNLEVSFRDNVNIVEDDYIDIEWFSFIGELFWLIFFEFFNIFIYLNCIGEIVRIIFYFGKIEIL